MLFRMLGIVNPDWCDIKKVFCTRCWWLLPAILATWEAEIRRIAVQGQPRKMAHKTPSPN
jgi:hypothetical protein